MYTGKHGRALQIGSFLLAVVLAPAAHAETLVSRDTGVGQQIAAQGNLALAAIKAELKAAIKAFRPVLPATHAVKVSAPATEVESTPAGGAVTVAPGTRCES